MLGKRGLKEAKQFINDYFGYEPFKADRTGGQLKGLALLSQMNHNRFLGMQPVFGLIKNNGLGSIHNVGSLLKTSHCRQAIHEDRIGCSVLHEVRIDLVRH